MSAADVRAFLDRARASARSGGVGAGARIISLDQIRSGRERAGDRAPVPGPRWHLDEVVGRLTELSGQGAVASLTAAATLVIEAQGEGEPVAWIGLPATTFFPPDLADAGVDLDAMVVVRAPHPTAMVRAADKLLRSGGFGLVVLDLGPAGARVEIPIAVQGRLVGLAQHHDAALVMITEKPCDAASLGSLVSLRAEAVRERAGASFRVAVRAIKDKRRGPGWSERVEVEPPAGLK